MTMDSSDWLANLSETDRDLYDSIEAHILPIYYVDADKCQEFMDSLKDIGITTAELFEEYYLYESDEDNPYAEFAEYYVTELLDRKSDENTTYDWQATWDTQMKDRFDVIAIEGLTAFFNKE